MEDSTKRSREEEEWAEELPEAKRLREDLLFDILDDVESGEPDPPADGDLDGVMRSLEAEIALLREPSSLAEQETEEEKAGEEECEARQLELGYLLEASDDELGLPPTEASSTSSSATEEEVDGFVWGFEDGVSSCYDGMGDVLAGGGTQEAAVEAGEGWGFGAGFFDGDGDVFWPLEWPELAF